MLRSLGSHLFWTFPITEKCFLKIERLSVNHGSTWALWFLSGENRKSTHITHVTATHTSLLTQTSTHTYPCTHTHTHACSIPYSTIQTVSVHFEHCYHTHTKTQEEEEEEEMRSPGRAPPRHIPMVPAGPPRSGTRPRGGCHPNPSGYTVQGPLRVDPVSLRTTPQLSIKNSGGLWALGHSLLSQKSLRGSQIASGSRPWSPQQVVPAAKPMFRSGAPKTSTL